METAPDRLIGRYRVLGALGAGAMGEVLRARDERLSRDVAIKKVRNLFGVVSATFHARFDAEARALAALAHPGVVQVFDTGVDGDEPYLVMELVDGPSLRQVLAEGGPLPPAEVRALGIQVARALEAAHARGILHRDLKPGNVLRAPGGWKLADFGVAHLPDSDMTFSGQFVGTPAYAAPEALSLGLFSPASDVFGLAALLVEAATGAKPRGDATLTELVARSSQPIVMPDGVPDELQPALAAGLAIDPARRPSAERMAEMLAHAAPSGASTSAPTPPTPSLAPVAVPVEPPSIAPSEPRVASPRQRRLRWIAYVAGGVMVIGLFALIDRSCSGGGSGAGAKHPAAGLGTSFAAPGASDDDRGGDTPTRIDPPADLDDEGLEAWSEMADRANDGRYREALDRLDDFESRFGRTPETGRLRSWLQRAAADDEPGPPGPGRGKGHKKHRE